MSCQDKFKFHAEERWKENFAKLKQFKEQYGHANPPRRFSAPGFKNLGMWLDRQRRGRRNEERLALNLPCKGTHRLSADKIQSLTVLGVQWDFGLASGSQSTQNPTFREKKPDRLDNSASDGEDESVDASSGKESVDGKCNRGGNNQSDNGETEDENDFESESESENHNEDESESESESESEDQNDGDGDCDNDFQRSRSVENRADKEFEDNYSKLQSMSQPNWPECHVQYLQDKDLGEWVFRMRRTKSTMPIHQFSRLHAIKFDWNGPCTALEAARNDQSQNSFEFAFAQSTQELQRKAPAEPAKHKKGTTVCKTQTLARQGRGSRKNHRRKRWEESYEKLRRFVFGHCFFSRMRQSCLALLCSKTSRIWSPRLFVRTLNSFVRTHDGLEKLTQHSYKLSRWVRRQRAAFKHEQEMKQGLVPSGTERIEEYQIALLEKLGIPLMSAKNKAKSVTGENRGQGAAKKCRDNGDERNQSAQTSRSERKRKAACIEEQRKLALDRVDEAVAKKKKLTKQLAQLEQHILLLRANYYAI